MIVKNMSAQASILADFFVAQNLVYAPGDINCSPPLIEFENLKIKNLLFNSRTEDINKADFLTIFSVRGIVDSDFTIGDRVFLLRAFV